MDVEILSQEKDTLKLEISNLTIAEILKTYLNKYPEVSFAAWKREHPTKNPVLSIKAKNPKKIVKDAISDIKKELEKIEKDFSRLK